MTHPPLGKGIIALGIRLFGFNPFGWRIMGALFGIAMLPLLYVFSKHIFKRTRYAAFATVLFAADNMPVSYTHLIAPRSVFDCFRDIEKGQQGRRKINIYLSPAGEVLTQPLAAELAGYEEINLLCGHYEGVDQRILDAKIDREISIGDYILTGGELPAMVLIDCIMRHIPGVLGNSASAEGESFCYDGLLEYPQYTRPADFRGMRVPEVLLRCV